MWGGAVRYVVLQCSVVLRCVRVWCMHAFSLPPSPGPQLATIQLKRYGEDLLFYLYYNNGGDLLQLLASIEL